MKIPDSSIPLAYKVSKKAYEKSISIHEAIIQLVEQEKMNSNSARDYVYNFKYLMEGKRFTRTLNTQSMNYYFENLFKDYGSDKLRNPLKALMLHINYYEKHQNTTMLSMRDIYDNYTLRVTSPSLVDNLEQIKQNIETIEYFLIQGSDEERLEASKIIMRGTCFIAYEIENETRFAPSRFLGYKYNKPFKYTHSDKDGRQTNIAINRVLDSKPAVDKKLETLYLKYCNQLAIKANDKGAYGADRKFWKLKIDNCLAEEDGGDEGFPEGKIVERIHMARERNPSVILIAKEKFKNKYGKLFCQVCKFHYGDKYGDLGKDFIEAHHTIAVCEMKPDHKTKLDEIAMLCANCHRMVHKHRPWLTMDKLLTILVDKTKKPSK